MLLLAGSFDAKIDFGPKSNGITFGKMKWDLDPGCLISPKHTEIQRITMDPRKIKVLDSRPAQTAVKFFKILPNLLPGRSQALKKTTECSLPDPKIPKISKATQNCEKTIRGNWQVGNLAPRRRPLGRPRARGAPARENVPHVRYPAAGRPFFF